MMSEQDGWTPLYIASMYGKLDVVEFLVKNGVDKEAKTNVCVRVWKIL